MFVLQLESNRGGKQSCYDLKELRKNKVVVGKKKYYCVQASLSLARALNRLAVSIMATDIIQVILDTLTSIVGRTLRVDYCILYEVNIMENKLERRCQYRKVQASEIPSPVGKHNFDYNRDVKFFSRGKKQCLESHSDEMDPILQDAGMAEIIHKHLKFKSFFWFPFSFTSKGYFALAFGQMNYKRKLKNEELEFLDSAMNIVEIAIQKNRYFTERKQMEEALELVEKEKDLILSSISELVILHDKHMRIKWANTTAEEYSGIAAEDLTGQYCYAMWQGATGFCPDCPIKTTLETGEKSKTQMCIPSGDIWNIKAFPVFGVDGEVIGAVEVAKDITETIQMEKEMARFERLNLIGEMAAGFGHEIRNPMTTVRGFLQILRAKPECLAYDAQFNLMIEEIDRANSIISEFLSLAKYKMIDLQEYDLNRIIEAIYPLILADAIHNDQSIELELTDIPKVFADKKETHQLILNLVRNGLEAMSAGGCLFIKTYVEDGEVILAVQDQGSGIAPEIINKLGIPFVTTKENGTGLGLAICYSIVQRHNAKIEVETNAAGTTFYIRYKARNRV